MGLVQYNGGKPFGFKQLEVVAKSEPGKTAQAKNLIKLFGVSGGDALSDKQAEEIGPSRLAFRDCALNRDWLTGIRDNNQVTTEVKFENSINRIAGTAENPRNTERVPAGAVFDFVLCLKQLDTDDKQSMLQLVLNGLRLLEMDALGGSGSRGYGKIQFQLEDRQLQQQLDKLNPFQSVA